jgi:hypothetical protein
MSRATTLFPSPPTFLQEADPGATSPGSLWVHPVTGEIKVRVGPDWILSSGGGVGPPGAPGEDGTKWLTGEGDPDDQDGSNGDFYFNQLNGDVWRKVGGTWY